MEPNNCFEETLLLCDDITQQYVKLCNKRFILGMRPIKVEFDLKGLTAGMAYLGYHMIKYNPYFLCRHTDDFLYEICGHEVVHHAAFYKHGPKIKPHGREWRYMMNCLGLPDERCHSFDVSEIRARKFKFKK